MIMCFTGWAVYHGPKGIPGRQRDRLAGRNMICPEKFVEHEIYVLNITFLKLLYHDHERREWESTSSSEKEMLLSNSISWR